MATKTYTPAQQSVITEALNLVQERASTEGEFITSPSQTFDYFRLFFANRQEREHFALMLLDNQHKVLECSVIFSGTIDGAAIYPREIVKAALYANAAAVILAHNHPSGQPEPSSADRRITQRIQSALALVDIRVLDHVIVGDTCYSFAQSGEL
ncbi:MAG: DNA repair protein RadC [Pseudomonadales bacterium]|nr:DNA repair protein RadC [Pseudomonadales bacterium]